jgi:peptidoglycan/LPS O-acetylase OafA/YrhL
VPQAGRELGLGRVRSLDGLRGLAALIVLEHHALLASVPWLAGPYGPGPLPARGSLDWLLTYTPLHIFWAGPEFVVVFFVLSGFVLTLPVARGGRLRIASYYPSRFLRLYLPVWGALVFAAVLHVAVSHSPIPAASWWLNEHSQPLGLHALGLDALLAPGAGDGAFSTALWSLRWEVLFSLLLPVLLAIAVRMHGRGVPGARSRATGALAAALCFLALLAGTHGGVGEYLLELTPFLLGMLLAFQHEQLARLAAGLRRRTVRNIAIELALGGACIGALTADWWLPAGVDGAPIVAAGACLALIAALVVGVFGRFLESRPMHWTGKRAYSLYLVHEPLVVALAFAVGGRPGRLRFALLATALSLTAAGVFFRVVEAPSHRLARRWAARDRAALATPVVAPVEEESLATL